MEKTEFIERFREAVRIQTVWPKDAPEGDAEAEKPLIRFQEFLERAFPRFHLTAERWVLSPYSVIYRWPGADSEKTEAAETPAEPILFLAHYDVVAAETEKWTSDPFGAEIKNGRIYGRGTLDMKSILIAQMEAAERLCLRNFKPRRDIWFAFGGDEERLGVLGGLEAAGWFARKGIRFDWTLDEGTPVGENQVKGIDTPLALVSVEEKGFLSLELSVSQEPGHASRPPQIQAAAVLGRALCRIAKKPFPFTLVPTVENFFRRLAPYAKGIRGFVMRNARLFGALFFRAVSSNASIASLLHTTAAMTQLEGSAADNILPSEVRAVINLRLLDPWNIERAISFIKKAVNDNRVKIKIHGVATNPVPANPFHAKGSGPGWKEIEAAFRETYPGVPLMVFIMVATTDSRHFKDITNGIFRINPHRLTPADMSGIHGHDEYISRDNLERGLMFYTKIMESL